MISDKASPTIYTLGELLVEIMRPAAGQPLDQNGKFCGPFPSGAPAIFSSTVAQLGAQSMLIGGVGKDKFGQNILARLCRDGVDCRWVCQSQRPTAVAFVAYEENGEREFIYHIAGTAADDLNFQLESLPQPDCLHVMGCSLMASETMRKAIDQAVSCFADCEISFDPNLRPELLGTRSFDDLAANVMRHCSILLPGENELLLAAGCVEEPVTTASISASVTKLFQQYPKLRLIHLKRGEHGSHIYSRDGQDIPIPRYPIEEVMPIVDPTGAGDCFDAAFVWAVLYGYSLEEAGFLAAKAGALNVAALGPMEGDLTLLYKKLHAGETLGNL